MGTVKDSLGKSMTRNELNVRFAGMRECPMCNNTEKHRFRPVVIDAASSKPLCYTECLSCKHIIGADDSMSQDAVTEWISTLPPVSDLCTCNNRDLNRYSFVSESGDQVALQCDQCGNKVGRDEESPSPEDSSEPTDENFNLHCQNCGNNDNDRFFVRVVDGSLTIVECCDCETTHPIHVQNENDYRDITTSSPRRPPQKDSDECVTMSQAQSAQIEGKERIDHARQLKPGDHIAWWRPYQIWHHALVDEPHASTNSATVIHYSGPLDEGRTKIKGRVTKETLNLEKQSGILYRLRYSGKCLPSDVAIIRAHTRLDEKAYSFFTNNCEHFVRWCKTGIAICEQVLGAKQFFKDLLKKCKEICLTSAMKGPVFNQLGMKAVGGGLEILRGTDLCGILEVIRFQTIRLQQGIKEAQTKRAEGHISTEEFYNVCVRVGAECVLGGAGQIVGGFVLPLIIRTRFPVLNAWVPAIRAVGFTLGTLIAHALASVTGYIFAKLNHNFNLSPMIERFLSNQRRKAIEKK